MIDVAIIEGYICHGAAGFPAILRCCRLRARGDLPIQTGMTRADASLEHLVYLSKARPGLSAVDVRAILGSAQVKNRRRDVTGFLLYSGRHFVQVLEGRPAELNELVRAIETDERHAGLHVLDRHPIRHRRYGAWAMGFTESLDDADELDRLFEGAKLDAARIGGILERAARTV